MRRLTVWWWLVPAALIAPFLIGLMGGARGDDWGLAAGVATLLGVLVAPVASGEQGKLDDDFPKSYWARCVVCRHWMRVDRFSEKILPDVHQSIADGKFNVDAVCSVCGANMTESLKKTPYYRQLVAAATHNEVHAAKEGA